MKLLNEFKEMYNGYWEGADKLHVYATKALPLENDVKVVYKDEEGNELSAEDLKAIKLVYEKENSLWFSLKNIPTADDHKLYIYCNDELVLGVEGEPGPEPGPTPEPEKPAKWDLINNEESWNAAFEDENSALRKYYAYYDEANFPYQEDLWNTVENRPANGLDIQTEDGRPVWEGGVPVVDDEGHSIYINCVRCWKGAVNAPEAAYPWAVIDLAEPFEGKIRFNYKEGEAVYPWGEEDRQFNKGFAIASIPNELGMPELKVNEAGEAEVEMAKDDLAITLVKKQDKFAVEVAPIENVVIEGAGEYAQGENVKILISAAEGFQFAEANAPKVNGEALVAEGDKFAYEFVMGAAAVSIEIVDVVVEEIPAEPRKVYYYYGEDRLTEIDLEKFEAEDLDEAAEYIEYTYATHVDSYYAVAVPADKEIQHAYMNGLESFDVLDMFEKIQTNVGNEAYLLYVTNDIQVAEIENDTFKFVF